MITSFSLRKIILAKFSFFSSRLFSTLFSPSQLFLISCFPLQFATFLTSFSSVRHELFPGFSFLFSSKSGQEKKSGQQVCGIEPFCQVSETSRRVACVFFFLCFLFFRKQHFVAFLFREEGFFFLLFSLFFFL